MLNIQTATQSHKANIAAALASLGKGKKAINTFEFEYGLNVELEFSGNANNGTEPAENEEQKPPQPNVVIPTKKEDLTPRGQVVIDPPR